MKSHFILFTVLICLGSLFLVSCPDPAETPETPGFTVSYHANGADGGKVPASQTKEPGVPLLVAGNTGDLYREGYTFNGWNTRNDGEGAGYGSEDYYYTDDSIHFYAHWVAVPVYRVTYDSNGADSGSVPSSETVQSGERVTIAGNRGSLVREGYTFSGWNTASDGEGTDYAEGSAYTAYGDLFLYAIWAVDGFAGEDDSYPVITDFSFTPHSINTGELGTEYVYFSIKAHGENELWRAQVYINPENANTSCQGDYVIGGGDQYGGSYVGTEHSGTFTVVFPRLYHQVKGVYTIGCIDVISIKDGQTGSQQRTRVTYQELVDAGYTDLTFVNEE